MYTPMKNTIESLLRKNEKLKCKLKHVHRTQFATVAYVALFIAVGFAVEVCFEKAKSKGE